MKFRVERDVLAEAVTWTARTLPTRPPVPVLAGVLLEADTEGVLRLSTFDYEVSARAEIAAEVSEPGTVLVLGRLLAEISRSLPNKPIDVSLDGSKVELRCGSARFTLLTMPTGEYPELPQLPPLQGSIDGAAFAEAINQVTIAAGRDETLPLLTGVRMEIEGEKLTLLATDRYRLAMRQVTWVPNSPSVEQVALVRARTLSDVARNMAGAGTVDISLAEDADIVGFAAGGRQTTSLLVDGEYPPVRRLFPESTSTHTVTKTADLIEAAKRVSLVAERNTPIRLSFSEGQVALEAGQGEDAQASEALESQLTGEEITTAFNPQYLLDGLGALGTEFVRLSLNHPTKPVLMTGQDELQGDDHADDFRYLLVPIRFAG